MAAAQEFLVLVFMAGPAIPRGEVITDDKPMMVDSFLSWRRLVTIQAIHTLCRVSRHFIFVNDRILKPRMTLCALARSAHKIRGGLRGLNLWSCPIDQESRHNKRKCNDDGNKH